MRYNNKFEHLSGQTSRLQNLKNNKIMEHNRLFYFYLKLKTKNHG